MQVAELLALYLPSIPSQVGKKGDLWVELPLVIIPCCLHLLENLSP